MPDNPMQHQPSELPSPKGSLSAKLHPEAVLATVVSVLHACAVVKMPDGQEAPLAWKEIWPKFRIHDRASDFRVIEDLHEGAKVVRAEVSSADMPDMNARQITEGDKILVAPCGQAFGHGYRFSVSHVRVYDNPWDKVAEWSDKEVKSFAIESVTETYAWGTINPGVCARVPLEGLNALLPEGSWHSHQIPLPGDEIAGWFLRANADDKEQIVTLDFVNYVMSEVAIRDVLDTAVTTPMQISVPNRQGDTGLNLSALATRLRIKMVLLLDDDPDFINSLSQYLLDKCGITVLSCKDVESSKSVIDQQGTEIDLAILDVNLGIDFLENRDYHGIQVARYLLNLFPKCPLVLVTGEEINPSHPSIAEAPVLSVQDVIYKPFGTDSLYRALSSVGKPAKTLSDLQSKSDDIQPFGVRIRAIDISAPLEALRESLSAEAAVLFRICPITDEVHIVAISGPQSKYHNNKLKKLAFSPIRDAAIGDEEVFTKDARHSSDISKHRYLLKAYNYRSCVGVPVKTGKTASHAYALFAFHPDPNHFKKDHVLRHARQAARETGLFLIVHKLEEEIRQMKPFELMGQAYGSMAHDLSKDLSTQFMLNEIDRKFETGDLDGARALLRTASIRLQHAQQIVRSFRDMARGQNEEVTTFSVKPAITDILSRLQVDLHNYRISLVVSLDVDDGIRLSMRRSNLDQLLTNIILNAVQQIARLPQSFERNGEVCVATSVESDSRGVSWLIFRICDNGPGIHRRDFERAFDLHYTTKDQGCGMGLDICRKIAADVKYGGFCGTVRVQRSILLCGSTFDVCLPILQ